MCHVNKLKIYKYKYKIMKNTNTNSGISSSMCQCMRTAYFLQSTTGSLSPRSSQRWTKLPYDEEKWGQKHGWELKTKKKRNKRKEKEDGNLNSTNKRKQFLVPATPQLFTQHEQIFEHIEEHLFENVHWFKTLIISHCRLTCTCCTRCRRWRSALRSTWPLPSLLSAISLSVNPISTGQLPRWVYDQNVRILYCSIVINTTDRCS